MSNNAVARERALESNSSFPNDFSRVCNVVAQRDEHFQKNLATGRWVQLQIEGCKGVMKVFVNGFFSPSVFTYEDLFPQGGRGSCFKKTGSFTIHGYCRDTNLEIADE